MLINIRKQKDASKLSEKPPLYLPALEATVNVEKMEVTFKKDQ